jgi:hypothetical protein
LTIGEYMAVDQIPQDSTGRRGRATAHVINAVLPIRKWQKLFLAFSVNCEMSLFGVVGEPADHVDVHAFPSLGLLVREARLCPQSCVSSAKRRRQGAGILIGNFLQVIGEICSAPRAGVIAVSNSPHWRPPKGKGELEAGTPCLPVKAEISVTDEVDTHGILL